MTPTTGGPGGRVLSLRVERRDAELAEARSTTRQVARTFALACRLLPRDVRDDVYRLYLVFRSLDDLVDFDDPQAEARCAAVEHGEIHPPPPNGLPPSREVAVLEALDRRHPLPRRALHAFCAGMR